MTMLEESHKTLHLSTLEFPELEAITEDAFGKGTFEFKVQQRDQGGMVVIEFTSMTLETENTADKSLKELMRTSSSDDMKSDAYDDPEDSDGIEVA